MKAFLRGEYDDGISVGDKISADIAVISDCSQYAPGQPAITYGLRGTVYFEMTLTGPNRDLHSGKFGGTVANPANAICRMLNALVDAKGRIQVPGFYDDVEDLSEREIHVLAELDFSEEDYRRDLGVAELAGEKGFSTLQRRWCRPTFDIHGLWSGYQAQCKNRPAVHRWRQIQLSPRAATGSGKNQGIAAADVERSLSARNPNGLGGVTWSAGFCAASGKSLYGCGGASN